VTACVTMLAANCLVVPHEGGLESAVEPRRP
jgi:hypothetical protein